VAVLACLLPSGAVMPEQFIGVLWAKDGCRCERWTHDEGTESIRLYQDDLLLSRKTLATTVALLRCATDWQEILEYTDRN
jgi:hypothetical protein